MDPRKRWNKWLSIVTVSLISITLVIGLDMTLRGSVFHPYNG
jgi:hypothetical protein